MHKDSSDQVTRLLRRWRGGEREALDALIAIVYGELHRMAHQYLHRERSDHTLQSTALVHELYVRLVEQKLPDWQNRAHFFGVSARLMRQILVEYARGHQAAKRGGSACKVTLDEGLLGAQTADLDVVMLDDALQGLAKLDEQQSRIVELRFFAGLSINDTAEVLAISPATVTREWTTARVWLHREISGRPRS